jgi:hypothetical protein
MIFQPILSNPSRTRQVVEEYKQLKRLSALPLYQLSGGDHVSE